MISIVGAKALILSISTSVSIFYLTWGVFMNKLIDKAAALGLKLTISDFDDLRREYCFSWKDQHVYVVLSNEKKLPARLKLEAEHRNGEFKEKLMELAGEIK